MFQPETEDMLPRAAPKPSTSLTPTDAIARPTVPEISLLLGPPAPTVTTAANSTPSSGNQQQQPSYSVWKKQVIPKVSFPPVGEEVYSINGQAVTTAATQAPISNVYPLRTIAASVPPIINNNKSNNSNTMQYRRSLESAPTYSGTPTVEMGVTATPSFRAVIAASTPSTDVLTICAGTQTDGVAEVTSPPNTDELLRKLVSKADFELLLGLVQDIQTEQQRLLQFCEAFLVQQQQQQVCSRIYCRDVSTQCDELQADTNVPRNESPPAAVAQPVPIFAPSNPFQPLPPFQSPRSAPAAQSTAYRPATPPVILPKPATEKSMVMNELALKYLPSEKLNKLLDDLQITPRANGNILITTAAAPPAPLPLRNIENFAKGPSDISNASYRYLKKYRLLPEEDENHIAANEWEKQQPAIERCSPLQAHTRNTPSPYQRNASPLAEGQDMIDLEHIRNQPKFL